MVGVAVRRGGFTSVSLCAGRVRRGAYFVRKRAPEWVNKPMFEAFGLRWCSNHISVIALNPTGSIREAGVGSGGSSEGGVLLRGGDCISNARPERIDGDLPRQ